MIIFLRHNDYVIVVRLVSKEHVQLIKKKKMTDIINSLQRKEKLIIMTRSRKYIL